MPRGNINFDTLVLLCFSSLFEGKKYNYNDIACKMSSLRWMLSTGPRRVSRISTDILQPSYQRQHHNKYLTTTKPNIMTT